MNFAIAQFGLAIAAACCLFFAWRALRKREKASREPYIKEESHRGAGLILGFETRYESEWDKCDDMRRKCLWSGIGLTVLFLGLWLMQ